jgi:ethanolamine kinase
MASEITFDSASSDEKEARKATYLADLDVPRIGRELRWLQTQLPSAGNGDGQALLDAFADSLGPRGDLPSSAAAHTAALTVPRCSDAVSQARVDAAALVFRVVYGHNDLLSGNVLHVRGPDGEPQDVVQIIDYEYGGYNYCGFDVANHFCEHAGFDFDLDKWYPGPDVQHAWFRAYLERLGISLPTAATYAAAGSAGSGSGSGQAGPSSSAPAAEEDAVTAAFLRELGRRVDQFALASHCWWGLWAIVQAKHSPIDFDFISYSRERFRGYDKQKAAFFPGVPLKAE